MIFNGNNLKHLRKRILIDDERILFDEVVKLFYSKNYRSSYIMAWILITESLRNRIKIVADNGEKNAVEAITKISRLENSKQSSDTQIIQSAKDLSLIDDEDFGYLVLYFINNMIIY